MCSVLSILVVAAPAVDFSVLEEQQEEFLEKVTKEDFARMIHPNAFWLVAYVFGELFSATELPCAVGNSDFEKQWDVEFDYIFYYFCYRADSAKSIEAFLSTTLLHPKWEVKKGVQFEE